MRRVLLLRGVEFDFDGFLHLVDIEDLSKRLVALGVDLDLNAALRDAGKADSPILVGPRFELRADVAAEAGPGMFGVGLPPEDDFGAVDGPAGKGGHHDFDLGLGLRPQSRRAEKERRQREGAEDSTPITHTSIICQAC